MSAALSDLPEEIRDLIRPHQEEPQAVLDAIGVEIAAKRDEAKAWRKSSGIEAVWMECEEAYIGIDDANRGEFAEAKWAKPMSMEGPVTTGRADKNPDHKSTVYLRLTSRYVDAGAAKLGEILLPADDKAFSFSETPVPDVIEAKEDERQVVHSEMGVPLTRPLAQGEPPPGQAPPDPSAGGAPPQAPPQQVPLTVKDLALENIDMARKKAKAAETRIYDWMVEGQYVAEVRKVLFDAARIGVGVLKGPVPRSKRLMAVKTIDADDANGIEAGVKVFFKQKIAPVSVWVDPWNIFPDPACGENIHDGNFIFERDYMSTRQVRGLKKLPGYIGKQIDRVLKEGPNKANTDSDRGPSAVKNKDRYEVWYMHGDMTKDEIATINAAADKQSPANDNEDATEEVYVIVTLINDSVVKATINPLSSGDFPYDSMPWQRRSQHWAGVGVAEQMRAPQRIVNAAVRALLNNAGKAAGSQFVIDQRAIRPADGDNWTITPDKIWLTTEDAPAGDVRQSFVAITIPDVTESLEKIVQLGERFAEETTSIPLITQGQSGATTPDTLGATQLQNNNANQLLRSIGYAFDDFITEPMVRRYYEWLLLDPDVPNEEKGEYQVDAHGSVALVERAIQDQTIGQLGQLAANPIYGLNPKSWAKEYLRAKHLNPSSMMYSTEEQAKLDMAPPPEAPVVTVAKINAKVATDALVAKQSSDQQSLQSEQQIAQAANVLQTGRIQSDQQATQVDATVRLHEIQADDNRTIEQLKAELAKTAMQLQTERELNAANTAAATSRHRVDKSVEIYKHRNPSPKPPVQVPGRAGNGQSFSQAPAK